MRSTLTFIAIFGFQLCFPQTYELSDISKVWVSDNGDGTYKNPIIFADYSDPDVICVGDDFYMTSSSFNCIPGLPILHSNDLVNWRIISYALQRFPSDEFSRPQHGKGVWAPAIRYHKGEFFIYFSEPDLGIYLVKSKKPEGPWDDPILVKSAKGWIDPCPFWDENGNAYLVHAFAGSRAGFKSVLAINKMSGDGTKLLDDGLIVFDGHENHPTIEGPKLYKRNGFYYIFAPAGGVTDGWQTVLRSKNIYGPYNDKIVMEKGSTAINGPHQGAFIELDSGESWFIHFQDKGVYGRIVHLQPMKWVNDWLIIGVDKDNDGKGEPVSAFKKPLLKRKSGIFTPQSSDEFTTTSLGLQWQWNANYQTTWFFNDAKRGHLRLFSVPLQEGVTNYIDLPNLLLQKFTAPEFSAITKMTFNPKIIGEEAGLIIVGEDYARLAMKNSGKNLTICYSACIDAIKGKKEICIDSLSATNTTIYIKVKVNEPGLCSFYYSFTGNDFIQIGTPFEAKKGVWIGARIGLFCTRPIFKNDGGYADFDWFRIEKE